MKVPMTVSDQNSLPNAPVKVTNIAPPGVFTGGPLMVPFPQYLQNAPAPYGGNLEQFKAPETKKDDGRLYLCKDDFQPIEDYETVAIKDFLVQKLIQVCLCKIFCTPSKIVSSIVVRDKL